MSEVWSLPGYDVQLLLGYGATGEVWRARELATGDTVALKRLRPDADPAAVQALRREAALLRTLQTPYVVRLRDVVGAGADAVLVLDHAPGGSLAALLARRGALDAGEVVTIGVPLAQALAAAHAVALVHGDVTPANVLFTAEGMPLLADLGVARLAGERLANVDGTAEYVDPAVAAGADPDAAADVWALAALLHHLLAGTPPHDGDSVDAVLEQSVSGRRAPLGLLAPSAPRALVAAIEGGLADRDRRPDAAAFASLLRRSHGAAPVQLSSAPVGPDVVRPTHRVRTDPVTESARHARRRLPRTFLPLVALLVLVALAATAGWLSGRSAEPRPAAFVRPPTATASPAASAASPAATSAATEDWAGVLAGLDAARAAAFESGDSAVLVEVHAPGSAGLAADLALVDRLRAAGHSAHGLRHAVRSVEVVEQTADTVRLAVVDVLAAYEVRDPSGRVVSRAPARGEAPYVMDLVRTDEGWRLRSVTPG